MTHHILSVIINRRQRDPLVPFECFVAWQCGTAGAWRVTTNTFTHIPAPNEIADVAARGWSVDRRNAAKMFPQFPAKLCED